MFFLTYVKKKIECGIVNVYFINVFKHQTSNIVNGEVNGYKYNNCSYINNVF